MSKNTKAPRILEAFGPALEPHNMPRDFHVQGQTLDTIDQGSRISKKDSKGIQRVCSLNILNCCSP